jgi:putative membrane protein
MLFRCGRRAALALVVLTAGCRLLRPIPETAENQSPAQAVETPPTVETPRAVEATPTGVIVSAPLPERVGDLDDDNIAAMLLASNNTDISYARLVPSRAQRDEVRQFAQRMLTDHIGVNALLTETLAKIDLVAKDNLASLDMRDESAARRDAMRDLTGFAFDSAYITNEISYHQRFLASLDQLMLPRVRNGELKTLLNSVRPAVAAHLAHAEQVWANVMTRR